MVILTDIVLREKIERHERTFPAKQRQMTFSMASQRNPVNNKHPLPAF